mmetsp:Transcript_49250/g.94068  ORF Transcript_49250/g.94068 Transcript_49250/m.94068 type:complete len:206 (-) Transcript_49250:166-783(-)
MFMPASSSCPSFSSSQHLGPMVHMILVLRATTHSSQILSIPTRVDEKAIVYSPSYAGLTLFGSSYPPITTVFMDKLLTLWPLTIATSRPLITTADVPSGSTSTRPIFCAKYSTLGSTGSQFVTAFSIKKGTRPNTAWQWFATFSTLVTTTTGTGGRYFDKKLAGRSESVNTTRSLMSESMTALTAASQVPSADDKGFGVWLRMKL